MQDITIQKKIHRHIHLNRGTAATQVNCKVHRKEVANNNLLLKTINRFGACACG